MSAVRQSFVVLAVALGLALATVQAAAQSRGGDGPVVMLGEDYTVAAGERVEDVVVIGGSATIEGEVDGDAVAVMGDITLAGTARVEGDFVVVLGSATIEPGAVVERDLVVVASDLDAPPGFRAGGDQVVVVGGVGPGNRFGAVVPWFREGLLWGRPFVPSLPWMWGLAALFALLYLAVNFPVRAAGADLRGRAGGEAAEHRPRRSPGGAADRAGVLHTGRVGRRAGGDTVRGLRAAARQSGRPGGRCPLDWQPSDRRRQPRELAAGDALAADRNGAGRRRIPRAGARVRDLDHAGRIRAGSSRRDGRRRPEEGESAAASANRWSARGANRQRRRRSTFRSTAADAGAAGADCRRGSAAAPGCAVAGVRRSSGSLGIPARRLRQPPRRPGARRVAARYHGCVAAHRARLDVPSDRGVPRRLLGVEEHHDWRDRLPPARRPVRRYAAEVHRGAGARALRDLLGGRRRAGLVLDALGSGTARPGTTRLPAPSSCAFRPA